jgi:hypothetical protein
MDRIQRQFTLPLETVVEFFTAFRDNSNVPVQVTRTGRTVSFTLSRADIHEVIGYGTTVPSEVRENLWMVISGRHDKIIEHVIPPESP